MPKAEWAALASRIDALQRGQQSAFTFLPEALSEAGEVLAQRYAAQLIALRSAPMPDIRASAAAVDVVEKEGSAATHPGVYCLRTTLTHLDDATLWRTYTMLTNLESVFRSLKTDLGLRPVYHQIERRVEGHLFISVLAYHFVHTLRLQLKAGGIDDAWDSVRETLAGQQRITTTLQRRDGRTVHVRKATRPEPSQQKICAILHLSPNPGGTQRTLI